MKNYQYNQFYYTWVPEKRGLSVLASSSSDVNLQEKSTAIAKQRNYELDDRGIITEYFQYIPSLRTYAFAGIHGIEPPSQRVGMRDNKLAHIFVPAEPIDEENPSTYIPNCEIPYSQIQSIEGVAESLPLMTLTESRPFNYQGLLVKHHLMDEDRLAVLLSMEFQAFFSAKKRQIAFPLDINVKPNEYLQTAREITWLMHSWIPDGLKKSAKELCQMMGYVVAKTTKGKDPKFIGLCFVPKNADKIEITQFDLGAKYDAQAQIGKGAPFFLELARKAQKSPQEFHNFIKQILSSYSEKIDRLDDIVEVYECSLIEEMNAENLPDWNQAGMERKLRETRSGNSLSKKYCLTYLKCGMRGDDSLQMIPFQIKDCWNTFTDNNQKIDEQFRDLLPSFLDLSFELWKNPNFSKEIDENKEIYRKRLSLVSSDDQSLWASIYDRENGCIQKHLSLIERVECQDGGVEAFQQCVQYYGRGLGTDCRFREEIWTYTETLYRKSVLSVQEKIDAEIQRNPQIFDIDKLHRLKLEIVPVESQAFCEMYDKIQEVTLRECWYDRVNAYYQENPDKRLSLEQYQVWLSVRIFPEDEGVMACRQFRKFLENLSVQGRKELELYQPEKKSDMDFVDNKGYVFYWILYERARSGSWNHLSAVWDVIESKGNKAFQYLQSFCQVSDIYTEIINGLLNSDDERAIYYRVYMAFERNEKFQSHKKDVEKLKSEQKKRVAMEMLSHLIIQVKQGNGNYGSLSNLDNKSRFFLQVMEMLAKMDASCWEWVYKELQQEIHRQTAYEILMKQWNGYRKEVYAQDAVNHLKHYKNAFEYLTSVQKITGIDTLREMKLCYLECVFTEESKKEQFKEQLIQDALILYGNKKNKKVERQSIQNLMKDMPEWEKAVADVYRGYSVEQFLQVTLEEAIQYPASSYKNKLHSLLEQDGLSCLFSDLKNLLEICSSGFLSDDGGKEVSQSDSNFGQMAQGLGQIQRPETEALTQSFLNQSNSRTGGQITHVESAPSQNKNIYNDTFEITSKKAKLYNSCESSAISHAMSNTDAMRAEIKKNDDAKAKRKALLKKL